MKSGHADFDVDNPIGGRIGPYRIDKELRTLKDHELKCRALSQYILELGDDPLVNQDPGLDFNGSGPAPKSDSGPMQRKIRSIR